MITIKNFILFVINKYGYIGIIILIILENIFPPIPSELILTLSGFLSKSSNLNIYYLIIASTIGSLIGALILYFLGFYMDINKLTNIKFLKSKEDSIKETVDNFNKNGIKTVFISRLVPVIRSLISIPAGISKMNMLIFIVFTTLGSLIWNSILILFGNILGENYELILIFLDKYKLIIFTIILIITIYKLITKKKYKPYNKVD